MPQLASRVSQPHDTVLYFGIAWFLVIAIGLIGWASTISPASAVDDAYITYRYAANISNGIGLRFNADEWVLGTTTPLYTLLLGGAAFLTPDIPTLGHWIGIAAWIATIGAAMGWLWQMRYRVGALAAGLLLALQDTMMFSIGMETPVVVALMMASGWAWWSKRPLWAVPLSAALILTRADGALWVLFAGLGYGFATRRLPWREALGVILLAVPWFAFSWWRYGSILPNSVLAKIGQNDAMPVTDEMPFVSILQNWIQVGNADIWFGLVVGLAVVGIVTLIWRERNSAWIIGWWVGYVIIYQGLGVAGFTWYFVPPMMVFYWGVAAGIGSLTLYAPTLLSRRRAVGYGAFALSTIAVALIVAGFIRPIRDAHLYRSTGYNAGRYLDYFTVAEWLQRESAPTASVATLEIGIIGYHSERTILDIMGLVSPAMRDHLTG